MTAAQAPGARYHDHYTEENCRFDWRVELRTGSVSPHDQPRASPRYPSHRIWRLILGGPEPFESLLLSSWRPQSLNICHSDPTRKTHFPRAVGQKQASQSVGPSRNGGIQRNMRSRTREKRASWLSAGDFMSGLDGVRLLERVPNLKEMSLALRKSHSFLQNRSIPVGLPERVRRRLADFDLRRRLRAAAKLSP